MPRVELNVQAPAFALNDFASQKNVLVVFKRDFFNHLLDTEIINLLKTQTS